MLRRMTALEGIHGPLIFQDPHQGRFSGLSARHQCYNSVKHGYGRLFAQPDDVP